MINHTDISLNIPPAKTGTVLQTEEITSTRYKMQTLMFVKSLHITVLSSISGHQNSDFIYGSLVYPFGCFDSYDTHEIVLAWITKAVQLHRGDDGPSG